GAYTDGSGPHGSGPNGSGPNGGAFGNEGPRGGPGRGDPSVSGPEGGYPKAGAPGPRGGPDWGDPDGGDTDGSDPGRSDPVGGAPGLPGPPPHSRATAAALTWTQNPAQASPRPPALTPHGSRTWCSRWPRSSDWPTVPVRGTHSARFTLTRAADPPPPRGRA